MRFVTFGWTFTLGACALMVGCGAPPESEVDPALAEAELALTTVPANVQCIKVTVTIGGQVVSQPLLPVTSGSSSASLSLGQLPSGNAIFTGAAFNLACASVTGTTTPTWIADQELATLAPGVLTVIEMTFRKNNPVGVGANFVDNIAEISVGTQASYARLADGTVLQWGLTANLSLTPTPVPSLTNVVQVAAGQLFACARKGDGTVWCWGRSGPHRVLGPNVAANVTQATPVQVPLVGSVSDLAAGLEHVCATTGLQTSCWGNNADGQFGSGNLVSSATPTVSLVQAGRVFAGGRHTCMLASDGRLLCTGLNANGQLGDGTTVSKSVPVQVPLPSVIDMALGFAHTCALRTDETVRCWGENSIGQLGDGTFTQRLAPVPVTGILDGAQIAAGSSHSCVRRETGAVSCWGRGAVLGDLLGFNSSTPSPVFISNAVAVRNHLGSHTCAERGDRQILCWGQNEAGQIGDGTFEFAPTPTEVRF